MMNVVIWSDFHSNFSYSSALRSRPFTDVFLFTELQKETSLAVKLTGPDEGHSLNKQKKSRQVWVYKAFLYKKKLTA